MEEAEYLADKVAIMHRGKIVAMDEPYRLIEKYGSGARIIVETVDGKKEFKARDEKEVVRIIGELQEKYEKIEIKRANLEDVFLKLTGEGLG